MCFNVMDDWTNPDETFPFRLGNEKYKSKNSPRAKWLEQFDLHLFEEDQLLEVVVCSRNINIGRCLIDLKSLPRETTHRLWNKFEDCIGEIFLLLTISGTTSSETISDLTTYREDLTERKTLEKKYVSCGNFIVLEEVERGGDDVTWQKYCFWRLFDARMGKTALSFQGSLKNSQNPWEASRPSILELSVLFRCLLKAPQSQTIFQTFITQKRLVNPFLVQFHEAFDRFPKVLELRKASELLKHLSCTFVCQTWLLRWSLHVPRYTRSFKWIDIKAYQYNSRPLKVRPSKKFFPEPQFVNLFHTWWALGNENELFFQPNVELLWMNQNHKF